MTRSYWGIEHACDGDGTMTTREWPQLRWDDASRTRVRCTLCDQVVSAPDPDEQKMVPSDVLDDWIAKESG